MDRSCQISNNAPVPYMPELRVVPLEGIRPHEEIDPLRVERLARRIDDERLQINPVVCLRRSASALVLLDGATRTAALRRLGLDYGVVQMVEPETVTLSTWRHVVCGAKPEDVLTAIEDRPDLGLSEDQGHLRVLLPDGRSWSVTGSGVTANAAAKSLVASYNGRWGVNRVIETEPDEISLKFPDWALFVEFPILSMEDVTRAALMVDLLPAGITRFVVSDRALRINVDLEVLRAPGSAEEKQAQLDTLLAERTREGRVRRYEEPVIILDE